ncbi:MAG: NAD(+)/NADH kinase [Brevinematales bacterium]|nr:NAD(+)/NADH kinase [Brevinematales bacterium]
MFHFVAIVYNPVKEEVKKVLDALKDSLYKQNIDFFLIKSDFSNYSANLKQYWDIKKPDYVISVGGDGTILYSARLFAKFDVPIIGLDVGKLGFLMQFSEIEIPKVVEMIVKGEFEVENRMMLKVFAKFISGGKYVNNALNEIVVSRGKFHRLLDIDVFVNGEFLNRYRADGIIVSTPTGSTAYSLSAFGPIVMPSLENIVITPICPHTLSARSIVLDSNSVVNLKIKHQEPSPVIVIDGQEYIDIYEDVEIDVSKCDFYAKLVLNQSRNFFDVLRAKLNW